MSDEAIKLEIVKGVEGRSVYVNDYRVAGNKPWGGGTVIDSFEVSIKDFLKALDICPVQRISQLEKENAELKARLAHAESELLKSDETLMHYARYDVQYSGDTEAPCIRDGDGRIIDDYDYSQGHFKQFGKRARQRIKERKEFEG